MKFLKDRPRVCLFILAVLLVLWLSVWVNHTEASDGRPIPPRSGVMAQTDATRVGTHIFREYKYILVRPMFNSATMGYLFQSGKPVWPEPPQARMNARVDTPWGVMYWHGAPNSNRLPGGWMPYPNLHALVPVN